MELYLIRHGIAAERGTYKNDQERPLTKIGHEKTSKVAKELQKRGLHFDLILTSPLVRAKETAAILQDVGLGSLVEESESLAPEGDIHQWLSWLQQRWRKTNAQRRLALVGHQPDLANWAEMLVWGVSNQKLVLKKAGVIGLKLPLTGKPFGRSELFLLTSPKWLL